jgi:hypothetical protein
MSDDLRKTMYECNAMDTLLAGAYTRSRQSST